jgi:hypothetical protein
MLAVDFDVIHFAGAMVYRQRGYGHGSMFGLQQLANLKFPHRNPVLAIQ